LQEEKKEERDNKFDHGILLKTDLRRDTRKKTKKKWNPK